MAKDPYRYFRVEARELHQQLGQDVIALGRDGPDAEVLTRVLRQAHTLKGAARVVKAMSIADAAHAIEDALAGIREAHGEVPPSVVQRVLALLDEIGADIATLDSPAPFAAPAQREDQDPRRPVDSVRIEIPRLDELIEEITSAGVALHSLELHQRALSEALEREHRRGEQLVSDLRTAVRGIDECVEAAHRSLRAATGVAAGLRLLPVAELFPMVERTIHDAVQSTGKVVRLETAGGECRLDAHVLIALREALLHIVRNAIAHGIEPTTERLAAGKPASGTIEIRVDHSAHRARIVCRDDGAGVDTEAIRRAAVARAIVAAKDAAKLPDAEVLKLAFRGGISTSGTPDAVSGRGVGLEVVRYVIARCNGSVVLHSERGRGTTIDISVPLSLATMRVLAVQVDERRFAIPVDAVRGTVLVTPAELVPVSDGLRLDWQNEAIAFVNLELALGWASARNAHKGSRTAVIIEVDGRRAAVGVTRLVGALDATVRPLPEMAGDAPGVQGALFGPDGGPMLVLDAAALVARAMTGAGSDAPAAELGPLLVLVIDDSLTSRMLQQSILETAGYQVDLAVTAEEGLELAMKRRYAAFLVDVELPGMSGFEFVARTRGQPDLATVPAILITSRGGDEDRRKGMNAGACAYFVKSEFDERELLRTLRGVVGDA